MVSHIFHESITNRNKYIEKYYQKLHISDDYIHAKKINIEILKTSRTQFEL